METFTTHATAIKKSIFCSVLILCCLRITAQVSETEPNDDISTANTIPLDSTIIAAICPGSESDFFRIIMPDDGVLMVNTLANQTNYTLGGPVGLLFAMYDKYGGYMGGYPVPTDTTAGVYASGSFSYPCISADTFYLKVYTGMITYECVDYNFTCTLEPPVFSNDNEPNDNIASAVFFEAGTSQPGHFGFYGSGGPYDYYKIFKPDTGNLYLEVKSTHAAEDLTSQITIAFYDKTGGYLGGNNFIIGAENNIAIDTCIIAGTAPDSFYVSIGMYTCGSYSLSYPGIISDVSNFHPDSQSIIAFPNPTEGIIQLNLNHQAAPGKLELLDIMGKVVFEKTSFENPSSIRIDGSGLAAGIYYARVVFIDGCSGIVQLEVTH